MLRRTLLTSSLSILGTGHTIVRAGSDAVQRIDALTPNHGLRLGLARVVGEFNAVARQFDLHRTGPRSRDYSKKMVWAPERRRALFAGANHGAPHRLNDVWEFDLAAMSWILLYAPDNPRSYAGLGKDPSDVVFRDGVLQTLRGGPAVIGHTWSGLTYDPRAQRMVFMNTWPIAVDPLIRQVGGDPGERFRGPPLWTFNPRNRSWAILKTAPPWPFAAVGALLQDVPELDGQIWHMNNWQLQATWLLQASGKWTVLADRKSTPSFERDRTGPRTGRLPRRQTPTCGGTVSQGKLPFRHTVARVGVHRRSRQHRPGPRWTRCLHHVLRRPGQRPWHSLGLPHAGTLVLRSRSCTLEIDGSFGRSDPGWQAHAGLFRCSTRRHGRAEWHRSLGMAPSVSALDQSLCACSIGLPGAIQTRCLG